MRQTTYQERFVETIAAFCGNKRPSMTLIEAWEAGTSEALMLQDWISANCSLDWAAAIELLEAAEHLASRPNPKYKYQE